MGLLRRLDVFEVKPPIAFPKSAIRKIDRIKKKTPFRFDPVPSLLLEEWLTVLDLPELKCILYICRRTWGFRKEWDAISNQQFQSGVVDRNGKQVDCGTGLSECSVRRTLSRLESKGLIEVNRRNTKAHLYRLTIFRGIKAEIPQPNLNSQSGVS